MHHITLRSIIPALALLCAISCASSPRDTPHAPTEEPVDAPTLEVMTYNVNYGLAGDMDTILAISNSGAQLVLLQETTPEWESSLRELLSTDYPHMHFVHCCGAGGLAVLSTRPFEILEMLAPPDGGWFPAMLLRAQTEIGPLPILQVHLRPPLSESGSVLSGYISTPRVRQAEITHYLEAIEARHHMRPALVVGDFNEKHGRALSHLEAQGMKSALPEFTPSQHTWRWQTSLGQVTQRLDHVVYDPEQLTARQAAALDAGRSDHLPVVATFHNK